MLVYAYLIAILATIGAITVIDGIERTIRKGLRKKRHRARARQVRAAGFAVMRDFYERERKKEFMKNAYEWGQNP